MLGLALALPGLPALAALDYTTSWVGNSGGASDEGSQRKWVQNSIDAISVRPDGRVFAITRWDEGTAEISVYANGAVLAQGSDTHGWGNTGGEAITTNSHYLFGAMRIDNEDGALLERDGPAPPPPGIDENAAEAKRMPRTNWPAKGHSWFGVTRRELNDLSHGAPFANGIGNRGGPTARSFLLINDVKALPQTASSSPVDGAFDGAVRGLAADEHFLYVANTGRNRVEVYDAESMRLQHSFAVEQPGKLAVDTDGSLWVIARFAASRRARVEHYSAAGALLGVLPMPQPQVSPVDLTLDRQHDLWVADGGAAQQILVFTPNAGQYRLSRRLGEAGGLFGSRMGTPGPLRFDGLVGLGVDAQGNFYVATNGYGPRPVGGDRGTFGSVLDSYTNNGKRRWQLLGLLFADGLDIDPDAPGSVFSGSKHFEMDDGPTPAPSPAAAQGRAQANAGAPGWRYVGSTASRAKYPQDAVFNLDRGWRGEPMVRRLAGKRLLYLTDMYSSYLKIYRFDEKTDGEVAIPSGFFSRAPVTGTAGWPPHQPQSGEWIWRDSNGNGRFEAQEFARPASHAEAPSLWDWWVDTRGDVWQATVNHGLRQFVFGGLDAHGNPIYRYDSLRSWPMPAPFTALHRLIYDARNDVMYLSGYTRERPYDPAFWKEAGRVFARYDHWRTQPRLRYTVDLPWRVDAPPRAVTIAFALAGDFIFSAETFSATVHVYRADSGQEVGQMRPGPEVGGKSGWVDVPHGISAWRVADGSYRIAVEEDQYGKVIVYRWKGG